MLSSEFERWYMVSIAPSTRRVIVDIELLSTASSTKSVSSSKKYAAEGVSFRVNPSSRLMMSGCDGATHRVFRRGDGFVVGVGVHEQLSKIA